LKNTQLFKTKLKETFEFESQQL